MKKVERQGLIREIITHNQIERQDDLVKALEKQGVKATQATISRDIKELQLVKVPATNGGYRYALPSQGNLDSQDRLSRELTQNLVSLKRQNQFISLLMRPGNGPMMATLIRQFEDEGVFSTIGDDAGVLVTCISDEAAEKIEGMLRSLITRGD